MMIDTADVVRHIPTDEEWLVAFVEEGRLCACGWPCTLAPVGECVLVAKATPEERDRLLGEMSRMSGSDMRKSYALKAMDPTP